MASENLSNLSHLSAQQSSHVVNVGVTDQITKGTAVVPYDLERASELPVFFAVVSGYLQRPVKRLFTPDGEEIETVEALVQLFDNRHPEDQLHGQVISTDGSDFAFKWGGTHNKYQFGDLLINPMLSMFKRGQKKYKEPPQPPQMPLTGNLTDLGTDAWRAFFAIEEKYGPLVKLRIFNDIIYLCADPETFRECSELSDKRIPGCTFGMPTMAAKGVFIADGQQWQFGREALQKKLTPENIEDLVPSFAEKATLLEQNSLAGSKGPVEIMDWVERLTYDVICEVGFGYQPNMLKRPGEKEAFVEVFDELLDISINSVLYGATDILGTIKKRYKKQMKVLCNSLDEMIESARQNPGMSLLHYLIDSRCPWSGRSLEQSELRDQLITLLVAGHKTTTLLLTWALWHIATDGDAEEQVVAELQRVFGDDPTRMPEAADLRDLPYLDKVIKETLRLASPVQVAQRGLTQPLEVGGYTLMPHGYKGRGNSWLALHIMGISHSKKYWGEDAHDFRPERFNPEEMKTWHPYQYVPFGGGRRLCIGNLFAILQVKTSIAIILRKYSLRPVPGKDIKIDPKDLATPLSGERGGGVWLRFHKRKNWQTPMGMSPRARQPTAAKLMQEEVVRSQSEANAPVDGKGQQLFIVWGGDFGTTLKEAHLLHGEAQECNFQPRTNSAEDVTVDDLAGLDKDAVIVVLMATYNGHAPARADAFVKGLVAAAEKANGCLEGKRFTVLGAGNSNWISTYMRCAQVVDDALERCGGTRIFPMEEADKNSTYKATVMAWRAALLRSLAGAECMGTLNVDAAMYTAAKPYISMRGDVTTPGSPEELKAWETVTRPTLWEKNGLSKCPVVGNEEVCSTPPESDKYKSVKKITIQLPESLTYECGDHLEVVPLNTPSVIKNLCERFGFHPEAVVYAESSRSAEVQDKRAQYMIAKGIRVAELLAIYPDVMAIPDQESLAMLAEAAQDAKDKESIHKLILINNTEAYDEWYSQGKNYVDCLTEWPSIKLSLARLVEATPKIQPRLYSIASSPRLSPNKAELCMGVVRYDTMGGLARYGLASTMLSEKKVGEDAIVCKINNVPHMRLPEDPNVSIVCVCGGTGIAPFLGFLQDRSALKASGATVGEMALYFGCRADYDLLHIEQIRKWEAEGICKLSVSFSRKAGVDKEYVYQALERDQDSVAALLADDSQGRFYVCGSASGLAKDTTRYMHHILGKGSLEDGVKRFNALQDQGRIVLDVWG